MAERKVYAAKLALVDNERVMTVLSIGPFSEWTKLLRHFLDSGYEEGPTHQWSVLVDAEVKEGDKKSEKDNDKRQVLWAPIYFSGIKDLLGKGKSAVGDEEA